MLRGILAFVSLSIGLGAALILLIIFVAIWLSGGVCLEEPNIFIRSLETAMLVFAIVGLATMMYKTLANLVDTAEKRKKGTGPPGYNPPGGKK
jgi:4-hydroxybenzoate polyprenyltransferase